MAHEPERPIEKLLRAAAKRRCDDAGAPFELHPATRRLLQGEVARQFPKTQPRTRSLGSLLVQLWPRLAWSLAILVFVGVVVWTLGPAPVKHKQAALLARNEAGREAGPAKVPLPPAPTAQAEVPPPPAAAVPASAPGMAAADTTPPPPRQVVTPIPSQSPPLAKDRAVAAADLSDQEKIAPPVTLESADRQRAARLGTAAPASSAPPQAVTFANNAAGARYGLAAGAAQPAPVAAAPGSAPDASPPAGVFVAEADKPASPLFDESASLGHAYKSVAAATASAPSESYAAAMDAARPAARTLKESRGARVVQRFVQLTPAGETATKLADRAKAAQAVLATFEVEQDGRQLRITDRDGSIYTGYLQVADAVGRTRSFKAEAPAATPAAGTHQAAFEDKAQLGYDADGLAVPSYSFRVAGTNRSLKQKVVFTGNFTPPANRVHFFSGSTNLALVGRLGSARADTPQSALLPLLNSSITGKVVIGSGKPIDINALPAAP